MGAPLIVWALLRHPAVRRREGCASLPGP